MTHPSDTYAKQTDNAVDTEDRPYMETRNPSVSATGPTIAIEDLGNGEVRLSYCGHARIYWLEHGLKGQIVHPALELTRAKMQEIFLDNRKTYHKTFDVDVSAEGAEDLVIVELTESCGLCVWHSGNPTVYLVEGEYPSCLELHTADFEPETLKLFIDAPSTEEDARCIGPIQRGDWQSLIGSAATGVGVLNVTAVRRRAVDELLSKAFASDAPLAVLRLDRREDFQLHHDGSATVLYIDEGAPAGMQVRCAVEGTDRASLKRLIQNALG